MVRWGLSSRDQARDEAVERHSLRSLGGEIAASERDWHSSAGTIQSASGGMNIGRGMAKRPFSRRNWPGRTTSNPDLEVGSRLRKRHLQTWLSSPDQGAAPVRVRQAGAPERTLASSARLSRGIGRPALDLVDSRPR
jgi:hypothetical protein